MSIIKASDFVDRQRYELSDEEWNEIMSYPRIEVFEDIDDPKYDWKQCVRKNANDYKYGRQMVSFTQKIRRGQTMGEFYGGGIVD